jgi:WYL domain
MTSILNRSRVCDAISQKHLLRFRYADNKARVVEPHLAGENTARHDALLAWLLRSEAIDVSHAGGWRNYLLDEMHSIEILEETFDRPRPDYNPNDRRILRVYCSLPLLART